MTSKFSEVNSSKLSELTSKQYKILIDLYIEFNSDFHMISEETKKNFYDILNARKNTSDFQPANKQKNGE